MNLTLKELLLTGDPAFWTELTTRTQLASGFEELFLLSSLRKKAIARGLRRPDGIRSSLRLAILGVCSLYPLHDLLTHLLESTGVTCELFLGDFDNYVSEIIEENGPLY